MPHRPDPYSGRDNRYAGMDAAQIFNLRTAPENIDQTVAEYRAAAERHDAATCCKTAVSAPMPG